MSLGDTRYPGSGTSFRDAFMAACSLGDFPKPIGNPFAMPLLSGGLRPSSRIQALNFADSRNGPLVALYNLATPLGGVPTFSGPLQVPDGLDEIKFPDLTNPATHTVVSWERMMEVGVELPLDVLMGSSSYTRDICVGVVPRVIAAHVARGLTPNPDAIRSHPLDDDGVEQAEAAMPPGHAGYMTMLSHVGRAASTGRGVYRCQYTVIIVLDALVHILQHTSLEDSYLTIDRSRGYLVPVGCSSGGDGPSGVLTYTAVPNDPWLKGTTNRLTWYFTEMTIACNALVNHGLDDLLVCLGPSFTGTSLAILQLLTTGATIEEKVEQLKAMKPVYTHTSMGVLTHAVLVLDRYPGGLKFLQGLVSRYLGI